MYRQLVLLFSALCSGCAVLHHVQIGDIDQRRGYQLRPIDVKVSETGVNVKEAADIAKALSTSKEGKEAADTISGIISLFQMGPHTGNGVFSDEYAEDLIFRLHEQCPEGRLTGINSVREARKYPVISGEIIKITGYCLSKNSSGN